MKKWIFDLKNLTYLSCAFVIASGTLFYFNMKNIENSSSARVAQAGMMTCFSRVSQTFTSHVIADTSSNYLSREFTDLTSECFADVKNSLEVAIPQGLSVLKKHINTLSSDAHWFHEMLESVSINENVEEVLNTEKTSARFDSLETKFDLILDSFEGFFLESNKKIANVYGILNICLGLFFALTVFMSRLWMNKNSQNKAIEDKAESIILNNEFHETTKIDNIIAAALEKNGMSRSSSLFRSYHSRLLEKQVGMRMYDEAKVSAPIITYKSEVIDIPSIPEVVNTPKEKIDLIDVYSSISKQFSNLAVVKGILFDVELINTLWIEGTHETTSQAIFTAVNTAVGTAKEANAKKISVQTKSLGGVGLFRVTVPNHVYTSEQLEQFSNDSVISKNIEMELLKEIMKDVGGNVNMKNNVDDEGRISGSTIELVFTKTSAPELAIPTGRPVKELKRLVKGSKREILRQMI
jgi:hypothetical protein